MPKKKTPKEFKTSNFCLTLCYQVARELKALPDGTRSKFVSDILKEKLEELRKVPS